jgi:hypothetical protein
MRKALVVATVALAALAAARWPARPVISFVDSERVRLRAHFDSVERELRARDVPRLTRAQRAARARLLDILHRYQVRGVFPENIDFPHRDVPVFIDWRGTRCGFAYLIEETGHEDLVQRIAATRNNALAAELKDDPEVGRWLVDNGVTLAEATRIQPTYGCNDHYGGDCAASIIPSTIASGGYKTSSRIAIASNVATFGLYVLDVNLSPRTKGIAGMASGLLGIVVGAPYIENGGGRGSLARWDAGLGAASLVLGLVRLGAPGEPTAQSRVSLGPWLGARGASGLAARVTF